ncbi:MAG: hypothetical protein ACFCUM_03625 [Bacteroidales bacterium]
MKVRLLLSGLLLTAIVIIFNSCGNTGRNSQQVNGIKIYSENPWYWEYKGKPVLLIGGSAEDNLFQYPNNYYDDDADSLEEHLDKLVAAGGNYVRNTMSSRNPGNLFPYVKIQGEPGINTTADIYDLGQWNDEYWKNFANFLSMCAERDIIVQIELFDRFDLHQAESKQGNAEFRGLQNTGWEVHPWNPDRNINYTEVTSGLRGGELAGMSDENELYFSVPTLAMNTKSPQPIVLTTLQNYVERLLSISLMYDNVLYVIENESDQPMEFGEYWISFLQNQAAEAGKAIFVSNMRNNPDPASSEQQSVLHNNIYTFFDFSQNNHNYGQEHYDNIIELRESIQTSPKPINNVKIYGGVLYENGVEEGKKRMWRAIFSGVAAVRFHREGSIATGYGIGLNEDSRQWILSARTFTDYFNFFECEPRNDLLGNRNEDEAYCLAQPGRQDAVYFTDGGSVTLDMTGASGVFNLRWLDIASSEWGRSTVITGGNSYELNAPSDGQWAVLITKQ